MTLQTALHEPSDNHPQVPRQSTPDGDATAVPAIVEAARTGDTEAFGVLYEMYVETIHRYVQFRVGNRQIAEDITAETFLRALRRIDSFTWQGRDIGAWLVTIARNLVADHFKSRRMRYEVSTVDLADGEGDWPQRRAADDPERDVINHLTHRELLAAVNQLSPDQRECIILRFLHGFSVAETARAMGRNEGAVKALQFRARNVLARLLTEPGPAELAATRPTRAGRSLRNEARLPEPRGARNEPHGPNEPRATEEQRVTNAAPTANEPRARRRRPGNQRGSL